MFEPPKLGAMGENFAPSFTKKPKLRQEDDGNKLIFDCQLSASPQPDIEWYRGDVKVTESRRIKITVKQTSKNIHDVQLILDDVEEEDAGLYKVKAKNKYGEVSASINLNFSRKYCVRLAADSPCAGWGGERPRRRLGYAAWLRLALGGGGGRLGCLGLRGTGRDLKGPREIGRVRGRVLTGLGQALASVMEGISRNLTRIFEECDELDLEYRTLESEYIESELGRINFS